MNPMLRIFASLLTCFLSTGLISAAESARPNIVFIFADDQCFQTIQSLGYEAVETPNLDRLARRGTTFTHAYNMGSWSGAVCIASRTMLNSGRSVWNAQRIWNDSEQERQQGRWWSEYMKSAGYRTYMTGKWHCKADAEKAFDVVKDIRPGMPKDTPEGYNRPLAPGQDTWSPSDPKFGGFWDGGTHWSEVVANHATDFMSEVKERDEPFFMYLAFNAPHDPRQSPAEYVDKYPAASIELPINFQAEYPFADAMGCGKGLRDERLAPFPRTPYAIQVNRQEYFAIITHMDTMIGRILDELEATGKSDNTWIFFTADHGLACGQHGLMGKQNMYDHSVRVPFIVVGPGVEANARNSESIYLQDVMPTTLELAGVPQPEHVEFHSLLPLLAGEESPYQDVYGSYLSLQRSVRTDQHKLIVYPKAKALRLYDIEKDPWETTDLIDQPEMKPIAQQLFAKLQALQKTFDDDLDVSELAP